MATAVLGGSGLQQAQQKARYDFGDDAACERAANSLFNRLDRNGRGLVDEDAVSDLWPSLLQYLDGSTAAAMSAPLQHRSAPIGRDEWMSVMGALRSITGSRRFRSSIRAAESALAEQREQSAAGNADVPRPPVGGTGAVRRPTAKPPPTPPIPGAVPGAMRTSPAIPQAAKPLPLGEKPSHSGVFLKPNPLLQASVQTSASTLQWGSSSALLPAGTPSTGGAMPSRPPQSAAWVSDPPPAPPANSSLTQWREDRGDAIVAKAHRKKLAELKEQYRALQDEEIHDYAASKAKEIRNRRKRLAALQEEARKARQSPERSQETQEGPGRPAEEGVPQTGSGGGDAAQDEESERQRQLMEEEIRKSVEEEAAKKLEEIMQVSSARDTELNMLVSSKDAEIAMLQEWLQSLRPDPDALSPRTHGASEAQRSETRYFLLAEIEDVRDSAQEGLHEKDDRIAKLLSVKESEIKALREQVEAKKSGLQDGGSQGDAERRLDMIVRMTQARDAELSASATSKDQEISQLCDEISSLLDDNDPETSKAIFMLAKSSADGTFVPRIPKVGGRCESDADETVVLRDLDASVDFRRGDSYASDDMEWELLRRSASREAATQEIKQAIDTLAHASADGSLVAAAWQAGRKPSCSTATIESDMHEMSETLQEAIRKLAERSASRNAVSRAAAVEIDALHALRRISTCETLRSFGNHGSQVVGMESSQAFSEVHVSDDVQQAINALANATADGSLAAAVERVLPGRDVEAEALRNSARETLLKANEDGRLDLGIESAVAQGIRERARNTLVEANADGRLAEKVDGLLVDFKAKARDAILRGCDDGTLASVLEHVLVGDNAIRVRGRDILVEANVDGSLDRELQKLDEGSRGDVLRTRGQRAIMKASATVETARALALHARARSTLQKAHADGTLGVAIQEVAEGDSERVSRAAGADSDDEDSRAQAKHSLIQAHAGGSLDAFIQAAAEDGVDALRDRGMRDLVAANANGTLDASIQKVAAGGIDDGDADIAALRTRARADITEAHANGSLDAIIQAVAGGAQEDPPAADVAALRDRARRDLMEANASGALDAAIQKVAAGDYEPIRQADGGSEEEEAFSHVAALRTRARWQITQASRDGRLEAAFRAIAEERAALRDRAKQDLATANADGTLDASIRKVAAGDYEPIHRSDGDSEEKELSHAAAIRTRARDEIMQASRDGRFDAAIRTVAGERTALRDRARQNLARASADGTLEAGIRKAAAGDYEPIDRADGDSKEEELRHAAAIRTRVRHEIMQASRDGRLDAAIRTIAGERTAVRDRARQNLARASADGTLEASIRKVLPVAAGGYEPIGRADGDSEEEKALRHAATPRTRARQEVMQASCDGRLDAAIRAAVQERTALRDHARQNLAKANADGTLDASIRKVAAGDYKSTRHADGDSEENEALRTRASQDFAQTNSDGRLDAGSTLDAGIQKETVSLRFAELDFHTTDHSNFKKMLLDECHRCGVPQDEVAKFRVRLREGSIIADVSGNPAHIRQLREMARQKAIKVSGSTAELHKDEETRLRELEARVRQEVEAEVKERVRREEEEEKRKQIEEEAKRIRREEEEKRKQIEEVANKKVLDVNALVVSKDAEIAELKEQLANLTSAQSGNEKADGMHTDYGKEAEIDAKSHTENLDADAMIKSQFGLTKETQRATSSKCGLTDEEDPKAEDDEMQRLAGAGDGEIEEQKQQGHSEVAQLQEDESPGPSAPQRSGSKEILRIEIEEMRRKAAEDVKNNERELKTMNDQITKLREEMAKLQSGERRKTEPQANAEDDDRSRLDSVEAARKAEIEAFRLKAEESTERKEAETDTQLPTEDLDVDAMIKAKNAKIKGLQSQTSQASDDTLPSGDVEAEGGHKPSSIDLPDDGEEEKLSYYAGRMTSSRRLSSSARLSMSSPNLSTRLSKSLKDEDMQNERGGRVVELESDEEETQVVPLSTPSVALHTMEVERHGLKKTITRLFDGTQEEAKAEAEAAGESHPATSSGALAENESSVPSRSSSAGRSENSRWTKTVMSGLSDTASSRFASEEWKTGHKSSNNRPGSNSGLVFKDPMRPATGSRSGSRSGSRPGTGSRSANATQELRHTSSGSASLPGLIGPLPKTVDRSSSAPSINPQELTGPLRQSASSTLSPEHKLQAQLVSEREQHQSTVARLKQLEMQLKEARTALNPPKRFGVATGKAYVHPPGDVQSLPQVTSPKKSRVVLPALRTLPPQRPPIMQRLDDEAMAVSEASQVTASRNMAKMTRAERSMARADAIARLDCHGKSTWQLRRDEKVSKLQALNSFSGAMWDSFFEWQEDTLAVD